MNPDENDALWNLLGKAGGKPDVSPTFAQDVTRQVRQLGAPKAGFWRSLFLLPDGAGWNLPRSAAVAGSLAILIFAAISLSPDNPSLPQNPDGITKIESPSSPELIADPILDVIGDEIERIDHFDSLLTVGDVDDLADEEIAMLLF